jgi:subtilisin family serine protease
MKLSRFINVLVVASMVLVILGTSYSPVAAQDPEYAYVPGEVVVGFASDGRVSEGFVAEASALASSAGAEVKNQRENIALLSFAPDADVNAIAREIQDQAGVSFAEPNYIYALPKDVLTSAEAKASVSQFQQTYVMRRAFKSAQIGRHDNKIAASAPGNGLQQQAVPIEALHSMRTVGANKKIMATYPNDPYLWEGGWSWVGADIVSPNITASANICEIDTGVDYTHPDLIKIVSGVAVPQIIKGYDFVNGDADPMDDNGHGTHVAGIMVAVKGNGKGISGVSTGKVVAVKALDGQGFGTNMDIAAAIQFCAARTDIRVINMSLGGPASNAINNAINTAVNVKGKLVVSSAGNDGTDTPNYPAAYSVNYPNKVIAVAASGQYYEYPVGSGDWYIDYDCRADYSNYGPWVNVTAPGSGIYSTTPYDKPFWMNDFYGVYTRYDSLDGTSMAAPYISAAAARRWGYKPLETNDQIGYDVINTGPWQTVDYLSDGACWPTSMDGKYQLNVAALLDRGAASAYAYDAAVGTSLNGATLTLHHWTGTGVSAALNSGVVTPYIHKSYPWESDPTRVYTWYSSYVDFINVPVDCGGYWNYTAKVNKAGYTASPQGLWWWNDVCPGSWAFLGNANVPPKSGNFDVVTTWFGYNYNADTDADLDLNVWLPYIPNGFNGQPANFMVGLEGSTYGEVEPNGGMTYFPYARLKRDGGSALGDWLYVEDITVRNRSVAHDGLVANAGLPYYPGTYTVNLTDHGQNSSGFPLLGGDAWSPYVFIWKDGVIKWVTWNSCNNHWWGALTITSGASGSASYSDIDACSTSAFGPY